MNAKSLVLAAVSLLSLAAIDYADDPAIVGAWRLESAASEGNESPAEGVKAVDRGWTITKDTIQWDWVTKGGDGREKMKQTRWTYTLDPTATPPAIDLAVDGSAAQPRMGIYYLDGDTLKLCISDGKHRDKRPTDFKSIADSPNTTLFVLKRDKR